MSSGREQDSTQCKISKPKIKLELQYDSSSEAYSSPECKNKVKLTMEMATDLDLK
jgi:hypothetical protein